MTYRGHVKNGTVVLDTPAALPEGAAVEVSVVSSSLPPQRPPITSIDQLGSKLPGDPFGEEFEKTLREWRQEPWGKADPFGESEG